MMSKIFKFLLIAGGIFIVLAFAAVLTLKKMFPPEKIKAMIAAKVSETFGRETRLGNVDVGLLKGIQVDDFAVSEFPNFKTGTFVQARNFTLKFSLWPLLQKKVVIDKVLLDSPQITVIRNPDGKTFNFSTLLSTASAAASQKKEPESEAGPKSVSLTVSKALISNGKLEFIDKSPLKIKLALDPINLTVNGTEISKPVSLDLSVKAAGIYQGKPVNGSLALKCVLDMMGQRVNVESLEAKLNELVLDLKGKVRGFVKPDLELSLILHDIDFKSLSRWVNLPKELSISGSPLVSLDLKGPLTALDCNLNADFTKTEVGYSGAFKKDSQIPMTMTFSGSVKNQSDVEINKLSLKLSSFETAVKGSLHHAQSDNPSLKLEVLTGPFDLKEIAGLLSAAKGYDASGQVTLEAKVQGALKLLAYSGGLQVSNLKAKIDKYILEGVSGNINFSENQAEIPKLAGKLGVQGKGSSDFGIQASVKNFGQPDVTLNANFQTLDLGMFTGDAKKEEPSKSRESATTTPKTQPPYKGPVIKSQGQVKIGKVLYTKFEGQNAEASWKLTGITPVLDKLSGTAQFQTGNGKINKIPLLMTIAPIIRSDPSALAFTRMGGHAAFTNGTAKIADFQINSPAADLFARGTLYLPTNIPDLGLIAKLPKGSIGGTVGEFSNDSEGRPTFVFKLKGNWKPILDTSQIQKKAVEKATEEIKKRAGDILQNEGKKLLNGIFNR